MKRILPYKNWKRKWSKTEFPGRNVLVSALLFLPTAVLAAFLCFEAGISPFLSIGISTALYTAQTVCAALLIHKYIQHDIHKLELPSSPYDENAVLNVRQSCESSQEARTQALLAKNSELSSFNFTISHEIKAPVRAIDGYARLFLEDYGDSLDQEACDMIDNIRNICKETIALSNKLLEYTRIAGEEPCSEIVELQSMIEGVFESLHTTHSGPDSIKLIFASSIPPVIGDPTLLRMAITNIISNAIKFTRGKKEAVITAGCKKQGEEDVFYIQDNGAGFDMRFSEKIFDMFERMHTADEFEGSGVGLSILKKIILMHSGRVWITGEVGHGATVYFTFPSDRVLR